MFEKAKEKFNNKRKVAENWEDFLTYLNQRNFVLTPWCNTK